jgi:hypothetical protein
MSQNSATSWFMQGGLLGMAPFDPVGLDSESMRLKEVKNARLAMLSFVGYVSQAAVTVCPPCWVACMLAGPHAALCSAGYALVTLPAHLRRKA